MYRYTDTDARLVSQKQQPQKTVSNLNSCFVMMMMMMMITPTNDSLFTLLGLSICTRVNSQSCVGVIIIIIIIIIIITNNIGLGPDGVNLTQLLRRVAMAARLDRWLKVVAAVPAHLHHLLAVIVFIIHITAFAFSSSSSLALSQVPLSC